MRGQTHCAGLALNRLRIACGRKSIFYIMKLGRVFISASKMAHLYIQNDVINLIYFTAWVTVLKQ